MPFKYDACYKTEDIVGLYDAMAPGWKKEPAQVPGLEVDKLFGALKAIIEDWQSKGDENKLDRDLQALMALSAACVWFDKEQRESIDAWLEEVAGCKEEEAWEEEDEDWMENFPEQSVREIVHEKLKAREIVDYTVDKVMKMISVEFKGGSFGKGRFDGVLSIEDDGIKIHDSRKPGEYYYCNDDTPGNPEDLAWCLESDNWETCWEEEEY